MSEQNLPTEGPDGTIPVSDALDWTTNWQNYLTASQEGFVTRYFEIPIIDFQNILLYNPSAEAVRAYIGLTDETDPLSAKLILVPVIDGHNQVVIHPDTGGTGGGDGQSNVYDQTTMCPPNCGVGDGGLLTS